jgi:uncharacterized membrane protein YfcA
VAVSLELVALVVAAGVIVGVMSGLLGVGGGLLMVPFMVLALNETQHLAEGTSLLVIVPTALAGSIAHWRNGFVSFRHAALLALGGILGVYFGATLALQIEAERLGLFFALFLLLMGARMVWQGWRTTSRAS